MASDNESVDYQIRIEAVQALKSLDGVLERAANLPEALQQVEAAVQMLADKFGISFGAAQKEMQATINYAADLKKVIAESGVDIKSFNQLFQDIAGVNSPFGKMGDAAGWKALTDAMREAASIAREEERTAAALAKEKNEQIAAEEKILAQRKKSLDLAEQEQLAAQKEADEIARQYQLYGQVSRTAAEAAKYLRQFAGTEQGQGILSNFFGNYKSASGAAQQIDVLKNSILELSKASGTTFAQSAKVFQEQFSNIPGITQQANTAVRELNNEFDRVPEKAQRSVKGLDAIRIALGALVAMLVFNVIQAIQNAFREMISNIKEAELAIYNLINAERRLSEEGIDVTPKGLQETIDAVQKLVPVISKIQAEELVSRIATNVAPSLKFTNEQIKQLSESIAILYVRNKALGKSFDEVEAQVTNAFLTGKVSQGINQLGVKISDQIVKDEALRMGLVKTEDEFNNLSGEVEAHVKAVAMLSVVYQNAQQDMGSINEYMNTFDAQSEHAKTAWSNLLTTLGQVFGAPLAKIMEIVALRLESVSKSLDDMQVPLRNVSIGFTALFETYKKFSDLPKSAMWLFIFTHPKETWGEFVKNVLEADKAIQDLGTALDTPTANVNALADAIENVDFEKFKQKIEDIMQDTANARDDLQTKMNEKLADLDTEYQRKAADAWTDYLRKVEDINAKYEQDIKDLKDKQREQDQKDEAKYQLALWELRQRYLMDLEDALHARDARQILRLQRQYAFDKEALKRKHDLDTSEREASQRAEIEDAKAKRDRALADAKEAYDRKLQDQRVAKQRELDDLNTWYAREQADIELAQQRKLQTLIKGWIDEQKITQQNAAQVYAILRGYFGPGGMTDQLYQYMMQSLLANTQLGALGMSGIGGGTTGSRPGGGGGTTSGHTGSTSHGNRSRAEGGTLIATRPTTVTFGEKGPEAAMFAPMSRLGNRMGTVDFSGNMSGGMDGRIVVRLDLSPDLEARVVENSMNGVAEVITQINRSKF